MLPLPYFITFTHDFVTEKDAVTSEMLLPVPQWNHSCHYLPDQQDTWSPHQQDIL